MNVAKSTALEPSTKASSGFTLVELMITIAVLAIIVSIAAPNISTQLANQRVKLTTMTIESALKEAKAQSVIRRQDMTVSYDTTNDPRLIEVKDSNSVVLASYSYNAKSTVTPTTGSITFKLNRQVDTAITYTICDGNTSAIASQIQVNKIASITTKTGSKCQRKY